MTTARFAQLIGSAIFYPMLAVSGMFLPLSSLPAPWAVLGNVLPLSHAVAFFGAWVGADWLVLMPHLGALALVIAICLALTPRVFRWGSEASLWVLPSARSNPTLGTFSSLWCLPWRPRTPMRRHSHSTGRPEPRQPPGAGPHLQGEEPDRAGCTR